VELRTHRLQRGVVVGVAMVVLALGPRVRAEPLPDPTERLMGLARVWGTAKVFHPYLAYKDIDWDAALVAAIPRVEAATSVAEYRAAVQGMLAMIGDPITHMVEVAKATEAEAAAAAPTASTAPADWLTTPARGIVEVKIAAFTGGGFDPVGARAKAAQVVAAAAKAKVLIVDMRAPAGQLSAAFYGARQFLDALPAIDEWPLYRSVEHHGFRTQEGRTSGGYYSTFATSGPLPPKPGAKPGVSHVVFVFDRESGTPDAALALQAAGRATLVSDGALDEANNLATANVELPGKLVAQVRLAESLWGPATADVIVANNQDLEAKAIAIAKARMASPARPRGKKLVALPQLRARDDLDYADTPYPSRERRMLAGIRLWAVLDMFWPYRYLVDDWDAALREALPKLAEAGDRAAYLHVLRRMAVRTGDGHIDVRPAAPDPGDKPRGSTAIAMRMVEGKLVVVRVVNTAEAKAQGIAVGDVVETIEGKPAAAALAETRAELSGATEEARDQLAAASVLHGDAETSVGLGVRGADGKLHERTLARTAANRTALYAPSTSPHWNKLAGNIGYADLSELMVPEVGPMFEELKDTRAIVFDLRGYPNGTAWSIAPRVNTRKAKYAAQFLQPMVTYGVDPSEQTARFLQRIPVLPQGASLYRGKIVVLIDDRAISQAEHTCLFLAEAAGATFVGSPTHGTNGDVTVLRLPGGLRMWFTGQEVRHVDGSQLQRVGIKPDVVVRPTIAGVRAGKDEVLERALAWLAAHR